MKTLLYILILLLGFPTGYILSNICKDEIKNWKKRLIAITLISFILIILVSFLNFIYKISIIMSLFFIIITCLIIIYRSH